MKQADSPIDLARQAEVFIAEGKLAAAIASLRSAVRINPTFYGAWIRLGKCLYEAKHFAEAIEVTRAAERFDPLTAEFETIRQHIQAGALQQAENVAKTMLRREPSHARAIVTIAEVAKQKQYPEGAVEALRYGLSQSPANVALRDMLVSALEQAGDFQGAIEEARELARISDDFDAVWTLVRVLLKFGNNEEVLRACESAQALAGNDRARLSQIDYVRGQVLRVLGRRDDSIEAFRASLDANLKNAGAWAGLADFKTFEFTDEDREILKGLVDAPDVSNAEKCIAGFALAKASEAEGDWDKTMSLYKTANSLYPRTGFSPDQHGAAIRGQIEAFTPATVATRAPRQPEGPKPIFILGLPRSGSTLIEQILASHSAIEGTIEQPVLPSIRRKAHVKCVLKFKGTFLTNVSDLTPEDLLELGQAYVSDGALFRTGETSYFTDKLPFNFLQIGLIHKIMPEAVIIDARRNPMDCGFSNFRQYFVDGATFSYDLRHIGLYYNDYLKLMDHWDTILPGKVLHVQYEELVRDPATKIRELLDHVGLPFEDACLNFHSNDRAVRTASSEQVRQPINTAGIGAWRKVEQHLGPLRESLGEETLRRFEPYLG